LEWEPRPERRWTGVPLIGPGTPANRTPPREGCAGTGRYLQLLQRRLGHGGGLWAGASLLIRALEGLRSLCLYVRNVCPSWAEVGVSRAVSERRSPALVPRPRACGERSGAHGVPQRSALLLLLAHSGLAPAKLGGSQSSDVKPPLDIIISRRGGQTGPSACRCAMSLTYRLG
jgi:hypothetical protein